MSEAGLPTGRVTLLFTDIEGSTRLLQALGDRFGDLVAEHRRILRDAVARHGGVEVGTQGDGHSAVFTEGEPAVRAAVDAQLAFATHDWPDDADVRVRMGLHTGDVAMARDEYYGMGLHAAARVSSAAHGGQILMSEEAYADLPDRVTVGVGFTDLGHHVLKDLGAPRRLYQVIHSELGRDFPPPVSLSVLPNNLPNALSTFVGRHLEIGEIVDRLKMNRLVTVTGPGGVGKTRTSLQVAAQFVGEFEHGVWFVDLSTLDRGGAVATAIASVLGVRDEAGRTLRDTLEDRLRWQKLLLVVDNCEHVVDDCADLLASLLRNCAGIVALTTSREPLAVPGESVYPISPFDVSSEREEAAGTDAFRLFLERASGSTPGWVPATNDVRYIAEICRRLDGLPLAIELAAARSDALTIEQINTRISDPRFLSGRSRGVPERQQSLDALIDWSYELLLPAERVVLRRSAVFVGGFSLDAAEAVCGAGEGVDVLEALASLVRASLVLVARGDGTIRYRLLETVRSFALERLAEAGEQHSTEEAHCEFFLSFAHVASPELEYAEQSLWFDRLASELGNLTAAIEWSLANKQPEAGVSIVGALRRFWMERGHMHLALDWVRRLSTELPESSPLQAELLTNRGLLEGIVGRAEVSIGLLERALELAAASGDDRSVERICSNLGVLNDRQGDHEAAETMYTRAAEIASRLGDALAEGAALGNLGNVAFQRGDLGSSERLQLRALELVEQAGAVRVVSNTWNALGLIAWVRGDLPLARDRLERSATIARELGTSGLSYVLGNLAGVARDLGELDQALEALAEAVALAEHSGDPATLASGLVSLGTVQWDTGNREAAVAAWTRGLDVARAGAVVHEELGALFNLAQLAFDDGELEKARDLAEEMREIARRSESSRRMGDALTVLANIALRSSAPERAERLAREAQTLAEEIEDMGGVTEAVTSVAEALAAQGRFGEAFTTLTDAEVRLVDHEGWLIVVPLQARARIALQAEDLAEAVAAADRLLALADKVPATAWADCLEVIAQVRAAEGALP